MPGRLDDLSLAIGEIKAGLRALTERADEDRQIGKDRHAENQSQIGSIKVMVGDLSTQIANHRTRIEGMQPQIEALQSSWKRLGTYAAIGVAVLAGIGVAIEAALKALIAWLITKIGG